MSDERITIVQACPGSGKTRVFAEVFERLAQEHQGRAGVAAISFTNAAADVVQARVSIPVCHPHYLGTLDSFLMRFVVRPFGHLVGLHPHGPRLIPAPLDQSYGKAKVKFGDGEHDFVGLFASQIVGSDENGLIVAYKKRFGNRIRKGRFEGPYLAMVMARKAQEWAQTGRLSHSDANYLAARILADPHHGPKVREVLSRRFSVLLVDEYQDTGHFQANALTSLLTIPEMRGWVVGDANQAIYGFMGANPENFDAIEALDGAKVFPLTVTHRCPKKVVTVSAALRTRPAKLSALDEAADGHTFLVIHDAESADPRDHVLRALEVLPHPLGEIAILTRDNETAAAILKVDTPDGEKPRSKALQAIDEAAMLMYRGIPNKASTIVGGVLGDLLLEERVPTQQKLLELGITNRQWRRAKAHVLMAALPKGPSESWGAWFERVKNAVHESAAFVGRGERIAQLRHHLKLGPDLRNVPRFAMHGEGLNSSTEIESALNSARVATIHDVKGGEFDTVLYYLPKEIPRKCPSRVWWSDDREHLEERRVAFVAASRARSTFGICLSPETYEALRRSQPEFIAHFALSKASRPSGVKDSPRQAPLTGLEGYV